MTEKMAEIEERALARLTVPDALMPGQYYEGVRRDPASGANQAPDVGGAGRRPALLADIR